MEPGCRDIFSLIHVFLADCRADNAESGGDYPGEVPSLDSLMFFERTNNSDEVVRYWLRGYTIVYNCNTIISTAPESNLDEAVKQRYIAEAKFIRSLIMFTLTNTFGAIPFPTEVYDWELDEMMGDYTNNDKVPRPILSMAEIYTQIEADLNEAITLLPLRSELDEENYFRATKGAAQALLGKVLLFGSSFAANYTDDSRFEGFTERWQEALNQLETVINSGEYALLSGEFDTWRNGPEMTPAYRAIFTVSQNGGPEAVFSLHNRELGSGYLGYRVFAHTNFCGVRYYRETPGSSVMNTGYWGIVIPSQALVDAFGEVSGTPEDDPRYAVTIGQEGDSIMTRAGDWYPMAFPNAFKRANRKWECSADEFTGSWWDTPIDFPVIRYSDVMLMAAEASLMTGNQAAALDYLNNVRQRARGSGTTDKPADLTSITLDDIILERQVELALEGHRFFDLVRWGLAYEVLNQKYIESYDMTVDFTEGRNEFILYSDTLLTDLSTNAVNQNISDQEVQIYPNPGDGSINIKGVGRIGSLVIHDIEGRELVKINTPETTRFNFPQLRDGIYFITIKTDEREITKRYIKK